MPFKQLHVGVPEHAAGTSKQYRTSPPGGQPEGVAQAGTPTPPVPMQDELKVDPSGHWPPSGTGPQENPGNTMLHPRWTHT